ncbi:sugar kinase [Desulfosporosinus sp. FKA]|uniref:sugar kinase n=1 Tax=Desulfosporosinus sp. FKA TaxID=1969834 RepID=UPI000B4973DF|nr:sugar kinase [Desulfosporosinus sp. FKA]
MDVVSFGESLVVFNPDTPGPLRQVNGFRKSLGGAESNVLIALARLGHKVGWFSKLGDDEFGRYILNSIRAEGVDTSQVKMLRQESTGLLFKENYQSSNPNVIYYRKNSAASTLSVDDINEDYLKQAKILHFTGITPALSSSACEAVFKAVEIAKTNGVLVSFDPNLRLKLWSLDEARSTILELAHYADIIMPGIDEAELLLGIKDVEAIADYFTAQGSKIVAIKLGSEGCYLRQESESRYVPGFKVEKVIDTVGAGDGFAAGLLAGILRKESLEESGKYANGIGAMATLAQGDSDGYPYFEQLLEFMGRKQRIER